LAQNWIFRKTFKTEGCDGKTGKVVDSEAWHFGKRLFIDRKIPKPVPDNLTQILSSPKWPGEIRVEGPDDRFSTPAEFSLQENSP
jgi:hypothetical protein